MSDIDFEVIGVMSPSMRIRAEEWRAEHNEAWVPLRYNTTLPYACRSCRHLQIIGRLRDGVSAEQAAREVETRTSVMRKQFPAFYPTTGFTAVTSLQDAIVGRSVASSLWIILGVAALVLIAAIANAGSLGLSQLFVRHNELVVRQSLGATPARIAMLLVGESIAQALVASGAGVLLALAATAWLRAHASAFLPRASELAIDPLVVAICAGAAVLSGIVIGLIPALRARRWSLVVNSRGVISTRSSAQKVLVGVNVALSVVLLVGSTLLLRSVRNLFSIPPGFDATNAVSFRMAVESKKYAEPDALLALYERFQSDARQVPGVTSIALTSQLPIAENEDYAGSVAEERAGTGNPGDAPSAQRFAITPGYFATLRIPIVRGRAFTNNEPEPVIILNETAARTLYPDGDAMNKRVRIGGGDNPYRRVVAIVGDVAPGDLGARPVLQAYLPLQDFGPPTEVTGIVRTTGRASDLREAMRRIDPDIPFYRVAALSTLVARSEARRQFVLACLTSFSIVVLVLAMIGVYGLLALFVTSRRRELALRAALGASGAGVFRFVLRQGVQLAGFGILAGLGVSLLLGRFLAAMLYGVRNGDPATLFGVTAMLALATAAACAIPAWRASRIAPEAALRDE
jgi:putative ABC transport system permease protein